MRRRGWLIFWIVAIVFPTAVLGRFSEPFRQVFDSIFRPVWMHVLMHFLLYAGLCVLLILTFRLPLSARSMAITLGVVLGVGLLQESFQALNQGTFSLGGTLSDLVVDLSGGLFILMIMGWKMQNPMHTGRLDN